jgi:hypothetical protein
MTIMSIIINITVVGMLFHILTVRHQDVEKHHEEQIKQLNVPRSMQGFPSRHHTVSGFQLSYKPASNKTLQCTSINKTSVKAENDIHE